MIKISTKGRYAARFMLYLAVNSKQNPILLREIAHNEGVSEGYLEHVIPLLKSAGLIISSRGAKGGYALSRQPENITLLEIIEATEGPIQLVECVAPNSQCEKISVCVTRSIWKKLSDDMSKSLKNISLKDMMDMYENNNRLVQDYVI
ncbi:MAG: Rrf2 family transcriptional regulator [Candidatus Auribacterota bacterium]|jgi:Rrf2 family protein|nr:Rrf2 family transcriptional regulator [Candidatus Auribacterota bacterium]